MRFRKYGSMVILVAPRATYQALMPKAPITFAEVAGRVIKVCGVRLVRWIRPADDVPTDSQCTEQES